MVDNRLRAHTAASRRCRLGGGRRGGYLYSMQARSGRVASRSSLLTSLKESTRFRKNNLKGSEISKSRQIVIPKKLDDTERE